MGAAVHAHAQPEAPQARRHLGDSPTERDRDFVHGRMLAWLGDADLAAVRDNKELAKLPSEELKLWESLWSEVRKLRDETATKRK